MAAHAPIVPLSRPQRHQRPQRESVFRPLNPRRFRAVSALPDDILFEILPYLSFADRLNLCVASRHVYNIVSLRIITLVCRSRESVRRMHEYFVLAADAFARETRASSLLSLEIKVLAYATRDDLDSDNGDTASQGDEGLDELQERAGEQVPT